ncbi:hypothetical protein ACEWY4_001364 [Coilia grayii]|uniref:LIM domain only protein 3 n=1 Tax=Coilia grayii TaxID=363190 RepID=A0ABD1KTC2_9TELE
MLSVQPDTKPKGCAGCNRKIKDRYLLKALDKYWHEDCLKCACCDCRLGEVGSTLYTKANLILCRRDYLRAVCFLIEKAGLPCHLWGLEWHVPSLTWHPLQGHVQSRGPNEAYRWLLRPSIRSAQLFVSPRDWQLPVLHQGPRACRAGRQPHSPAISQGYHVRRRGRDEGPPSHLQPNETLMEMKCRWGGGDVQAGRQEPPHPPRVKGRKRGGDGGKRV